MSRRRLLEKAWNNPTDVCFSDLLLLVEAAGFTLRGSEGSHRRYAHPDLPERLNLQRGRDGKAKGYQVQQFLTVLDLTGLTVE